MSYQVLARKWRPQDFSEVVGQEHAVKALSNALESEKVHQAYLFSGTRGVGKTTLGRILTKSLNCEKGLTSKACNQCSNCQAINEGRFPDFLEVDAASRRGVEETQQLLETVMYVPGSSRWKVYLIDEVHMLSKHSFNALLKTLEEPPSHVVFILATTEPESVPATVLSRCLQFHLKNLTPSQLSGRLVKILNEEGIKHDTESINQISRASRGSLRDCLTIADQAIAFCNGEITSSSISEMLGTLPNDHVFDLVESVVKRQSKDLLEHLKKISNLSVDYQKLMDLILEAIQYVAVAQISPESIEDLNLQSDVIISLAENLDSEEVQILYQIGLLAKRDMDLAPDIRDGFEMALLRMMAFLPEEYQDKENKKKIKINHKNKDKKTDLKEKESVEKEDPEVKLESPIENDISEFIDKKKWNEIFKSLDLDPSTRLQVSHCSFLRIEDNTKIYFSMPKNKLELFSDRQREKFCESLKTLSNSVCSIFFEEGEANQYSPVQIEEKHKELKLNEARDSINQDSNVNLILNSLGGSKIVDITPKEPS
mgnify:CR=1 FL=1